MLRQMERALVNDLGVKRGKRERTPSAVRKRAESLLA